MSGSNNFQERATRELATVAAIFAAGEDEIAATYFKWDQRDNDKEVLWLTKQAGRELESTFTTQVVTSVQFLDGIVDGVGDFVLVQFGHHVERGHRLAPIKTAPWCDSARLA